MYRILPYLRCFTEDLTMHNMTSMTSHVSEWMQQITRMDTALSASYCTRELLPSGDLVFQNALGDFHWSENVPSPCRIKACLLPCLPHFCTMGHAVLQGLCPQNKWKSSINHADIKASAWMQGRIYFSPSEFGEFRHLYLIIAWEQVPVSRCRFIFTLENFTVATATFWSLQIGVRWFDLDCPPARVHPITTGLVATRRLLVPWETSHGNSTGRPKCVVFGRRAGRTLGEPSEQVSSSWSTD